jgi:hypothetical protein
MDGSCDEVLNTAEFDYDGGDCCHNTCVPSLYECRVGTFACKDPKVLLAEQNACPLETRSLANDGRCDAAGNTAACSYDGGDCCTATTGTNCRDPKSTQLSECYVPHPVKIGDGVCDPPPYNAPSCNFDGGDCCDNPSSSADKSNSSAVPPFQCKDPSVIVPVECAVTNPEYLGDGWCDADPAYNSHACGFDGGDCCSSTCLQKEGLHLNTHTQTSLCGLNGYQCLDPEGEEGDVQGQGQQRRRVAGGGVTAHSDSAKQGSSRRRTTTDVADADRYGAIDALVMGKCGAEADACFADGTCGILFMTGAVPLSHTGLLQNLLKCIEDFDASDHFEASSFLDTVDGEVRDCVERRCRFEALQCQVSVECFLGDNSHDSTRQALDGCVAEYCGLTSRPTASPTMRPTVRDGTMRAGLLMEIDGGSSFAVDFKHITISDLEVVPVWDDALKGEVVTTASCVPAGDWVVLEGAFLIVKRGSCNMYDTVRAAAMLGATAVIFAGDVEAQSVWLPRDRHLALPVLSISYEAAESIETLRRRGKHVRARLSSDPYCDTMHAAGVDLTALRTDDGRCCAYGDVVIASLLFEHDFWNLGVREYPYCPRQEHGITGDRNDGRGNGSDGGEAAVGCVEPLAIVGDNAQAMVCDSLCKRNGVCEDGGADALGHACGWGGDCADCGPRSLAELKLEVDLSPGVDTTPYRYSDVAYGRPESAAFEEALGFICDSGREGFLCQDALSAKYAEFHGGSRNMYSSIVDTLCLETTCNLAGTFVDYDLPPGGLGGSHCCSAAQVAAAYIGRTLYEDGDLSPFSGLCTHGVDLASQFDVTCVGDADEPHIPVLGPDAAQDALQYLCGASGCMDVARAMVEDVRAQTRGSSAALPLVSYFPLEALCDPGVVGGVDSTGAASSLLTTGLLELRACTLLPFAEYLTLESTASLSPDATTEMTCCEASAIAVADVMRRADTTVLDVGSEACPEGCADIAARAANDESLSDARHVLKSSPACFGAAWNVLAELREASVAHSSLGDLTEPGFQNFVDTGDTCWLQWHLASGPVSLPDVACAAADVVLAHHVWLHPAPGSPDDVYDLATFLAVDDAAVAMAMASICEDPRFAATLDGVVKSHASGMVDGLSFQAQCEDPCRCKAERADALGCGVHELGGGTAGSGTRPFCYVVNPALCGRATTSAVLANEAWAFCSVSVPTCQNYSHDDDAAVCSPFVPEGASIFVPAGETLESLQFVADADVGGPGDRNSLQAWLLEAALVSSTCYSAHGQLVCDARLRRCANNPAAAGENALPQPRSVCQSDCTLFLESQSGHCGDEILFNDLLRDFSSAGRFEGAVCAARILPVGFDSFSTTMQWYDRKRLQQLLGVDKLLTVAAGNVNNFGRAVFAAEEEGGGDGSSDGGCFSSKGSRLNVGQAWQDISCPHGFVENTNVISSEQFCVRPCPSYVYSDSEHWLMWAVYTIPGVVALVLNGGAVAVKLTAEKRQTSQTGLRASKSQRNRDPKLADSPEIIAAALFGLFGTLPPLFFGEALLCGFDEPKMEATSGDNVLCWWNRGSIFFIMATVQVPRCGWEEGSYICMYCILYKKLFIYYTVLCTQYLYNNIYTVYCIYFIIICPCRLFLEQVLVCKMMKLYVKMAQPAVYDKDILSYRFRGVAFLVPFVCCVCSFALDSSDNESFHLARAGVVCRMRFAHLWQEVLLVHLPMIVSVLVLFVYLVKCCILAAGIVSKATLSEEATASQHRSESCLRRHVSMAVKTGHVLQNRHVEKIAFLSLWFACALLCWVGITVRSIPEFDAFVAASDSWFRCIRFVFARESLLGMDAWQSMREEFDGTQCPAYPDSRSLFITQVLRLSLEVLVPLLIAKTFSWQVVKKAATRAWQRRLQTSHQTEKNKRVVSAPQHSDGKAPEHLKGVFPPDAASIQSLGDLPSLKVPEVRGVDGKRVSMCEIDDDFHNISSAVHFLLSFRPSFRPSVIPSFLDIPLSGIPSFLP